MPITNPYIFGAPVKTREMFFGRDDVFAFLQEHLTGTYQDNVIMLYGQRRTGKTSLLYQLLHSDYVTATYLPIFISLEGLQDFETNAHVFLEIARKIASILHMRPPKAEQLDVTNSYFRYNFLEKRVKSRLNGRKLLLMIDEYEVLEACVENPETQVSPVLFHQLRHVMQHYDWLSFLLVGSYKLEELEAQYWKEFTGALYHTISFIDAASARALIEMPARRFSVRYTAEAVDRLLELSGNHPYFLQSLCRFAYANGAAAGAITRQHVEDAVSPCLEAIRNGFESIWRDVQRDEQIILATVAHMEILYLTLSDIVGQLEYWHIDWPLERVKSLVKQVERKEFLERTELRHYRYTVPFLEQCIRTYQPIDLVLNGLNIHRDHTADALRDPNFFKAEKNLRDAEEFAQSGDISKAEQTFHFVLETYPDYVDCWLRFGAFYEWQGKWDEALELYQQRLKDDAGSVEMSNTIALFLKRRYRFHDALEQFRTSLDIQSGNAVALANSEEIEYWLALDTEEQRLDYCLIPLAEELRSLDRKIDDLNRPRQAASPTTNARLRQFRERATQIERKFHDLQAQFPTEDLESRLSMASK